ncbi:MAG: HAMP domain-containing protein [Bacteroidales bacterium]|nr:HAMP domain-containing protein [Bacteroidales bacterium]
MKITNFFTRKIATKLIALFLAVSVIPIVIIGLLSYYSARTALENEASSKLEAIGTIKTSQITQFIAERISDAEMFAKLPRIVEVVPLLDELSKEAKSKGYTGKRLLDYPPFKKVFDAYIQLVKDYKDQMGYEELLVLSPNSGRVILSTEIRDDFGTELKDETTHLAEAWKIMKRDNRTVLTDFNLYQPSGNEPEMFVIVPSYTNGEYTGSIAAQFSIKEINDIMQDTTGLGHTGESYIVGMDHLMRSDSRFETESTVHKKKVETESVILGLQDKSGFHIIEDYRGIPVLSYYGDAMMRETFQTDFEWIVITEIDEAEAFAPVKTLGNTILWIGIIIAILVAFLAFFIARYFAAPLIRLTAVAKSMARGKLDNLFKVTQKDEIGELGDSFIVMQESLQKKAAQAQQIADGDLTVDIRLLSDEDAMGISFQTMVEKLRTQLNEISEGINVLASSSSEIMASVTQLASTSAETSTSVGETTTTVEEVKQTAEVSNQKAKAVSENAVRTAGISSDGTKAIANTIEGMNKIRQQMTAIAGMVVKLSEQSQTIGEITASVNELAEQSNLLAVNAAIEAAKAGEQGKGFTVVAQEIKMLADRSKEATAQVRNILRDVQKSISSAVMATEEGGKAVDEGLKLTTLTGDTIKTLSESVTEAAKAAIQIAASSQQQLEGMDQVVAAMENIKEASMQAAASTQQSVDSVTELQKVGQKLDAMMKQYKLVK